MRDNANFILANMNACSSSHTSHHNFDVNGPPAVRLIYAKLKVQSMRIAQLLHPFITHTHKTRCFNAHTGIAIVLTDIIAATCIMLHTPQAHQRRDHVGSISTSAARPSPPSVAWTSHCSFDGVGLLWISIIRKTISISHSCMMQAQRDGRRLVVCPNWSGDGDACARKI